MRKRLIIHVDFFPQENDIYQMVRIRLEFESIFSWMRRFLIPSWVYFKSTKSVFIVARIISTDYCKTAITPLLTHLSYRSYRCLALNHQYKLLYLYLSFVLFHENYILLHVCVYELYLKIMYFLCYFSLMHIQSNFIIIQSYNKIVLSNF